MKNASSRTFSPHTTRGTRELLCVCVCSESCTMLPRDPMATLLCACLIAGRTPKSSRCTSPRLAPKSERARESEGIATSYTKNPPRHRRRITWTSPLTPRRRPTLAAALKLASLSSWQLSVVTLARGGRRDAAAAAWGGWM